MTWLFRYALYLAGGITAWQVLQAVEPAGGVLAHKTLALDPANGMVFGVCSGISNYAGIDVTIIRMLWVAATLYRGAGAGLYILAFILMPALQH